MDHPRAWLVDVYDTLLSVDFAAVVRRGAARAGVDPLRFLAAARAEDGTAMVSPTGIRDSTPRILRRCGVEPDDALVEELIGSYGVLMREHCTVHEDAVDLLHRLRAAGAPTAYVSNCAEDTRPLLVELGLDRLVDVLVLSCEVGVAKPDAGIYVHALAALDVPADRAVFVDDQPHYCRGALEAGMSAVRVVRFPRRRPDGTLDLGAHPAGVPVVSSLAALAV